MLNLFLNAIGRKTQLLVGEMNGQNLLVIPSENRIVGWQEHDIRQNLPDMTKFTAQYEEKLF